MTTLHEIENFFQSESTRFDLTIMAFNLHHSFLRVVEVNAINRYYYFDFEVKVLERKRWAANVIIILYSITVTDGVTFNPINEFQGKKICPREIISML